MGSFLCFFWMMFSLRALYVARGEQLTGCLGQDILLTCPNGDGKSSHCYWKFLANGSMDNLSAREVSGKEHYPSVLQQFLGRLKIFPNGSLLIKELTLHDSGTFMCYWTRQTAPDGRSPNTTHFMLNVTNCDQSISVAPRIARTRKLVTVYEGNTLYLRCDATGVPAPFIAWIKDNVVLQNSSTEAYLIWDTARKEDGGRYTCLASNFLGNDYYAMVVYVRTEGVRSGNSKPQTDVIEALISAIVSVFVVLLY